MYILRIEPVVKHMNLVDAADGMASYLESLEESDPTNKIRLLCVALEHLLVIPPPFLNMNIYLL